MRSLYATALLVLFRCTMTSSATCNEHNYHCITDAVYQLCLDGSLTTNAEPMVCPRDTRCSPDCYEPCLPKQLTPCMYRCDPDSLEPIFHCVNATSYRLCTGSDGADPEVLACDSGFVCSKRCQWECSPRPCPPPECTSDGRKPVTDNPKNYYVCITVDGQMTYKEYTCPGDSVFDGNHCKTPPTTTTTTPKPFVCGGAGRFPDPENAAGYIVCLATTPGNYDYYHYNCPPGTVFNVTALQCSLNSGTTTTSTSPPPEESLCSSEGRFPHPDDCHKYFTCSASENIGEFISKVYTCPSNAYYHPTIKRCTSILPLGCAVTLRAVEEEEVLFRCPHSGRFPDSESCSRYYLCTLVDDHFHVHLYACPGQSRYNPVTRRCSYLDDVVCA